MTRRPGPEALLARPIGCAAPGRPEPVAEPRSLRSCAGRPSKRGVDRRPYGSGETPDARSRDDTPAPRLPERIWAHLAR